MFSINVLKENNTNLNSINTITNNRSEYDYEYEVLKLNDTVNEMVSDIDCSVYKLAVNDILNENNLSIYYEGALETIKEKLLEIIHKIKEFLKKLFGVSEFRQRAAAKKFDEEQRRTNNFSGDFNQEDFNKTWENYKNTDDYKSNSYNEREAKNRAEQDAKRKVNELKDKTFTFPICTYPSPNDIDDQAVRSSIAMICNYISEICDGKDIPEQGDELLAVSFAALARKTKGTRSDYRGKVNNRKSYEEYVNTNVIYINNVAMTFNEWHKRIYQTRSNLYKDFVNKKTEGINEDLTKVENKLKTSKNTISPEAYKIAARYLKYIKEITEAWAWFITKISNTHTKNMELIVMRYNKIMNNAYKPSSVVESSYIHGEPFNSDTLFDNEDLRDFNRTEWLDLELTTECYAVKSAMIDYRHRVMLQEALILTDDAPNKIKRLIVMKEAETGRIADAISNILTKIKKIIDKFLASIKDRYGANAQFLRKYKNEIAKEINKNAKISSKGDIIAGMYRVQDGVEFIDYNYETLKDDLQDKDAFFKKYVQPKLNKTSNYAKRKLDEYKDNNIIGYCKVYYGGNVTGENVNPCEFNGQEIQENKDNIIKFLQNSNTFVNSVKSDINKLEEMSKKISIEQKKSDSNSQSSNNNSTESNQQSDNNSSSNSNNNSSNNTNESYYSLIYGRYITEANVDMGESNNSDEDGKNGSNTEVSAFKVYMDVYKDVLLSKITCIEFIVSELMQILRAHVGVKDTPKGNNNNQNNNNNQEKK